METAWARHRPPQDVKFQARKGTGVQPSTLRRQAHRARVSEGAGSESAGTKSSRLLDTTTLAAFPPTTSSESKALSALPICQHDRVRLGLDSGHSPGMRPEEPLEQRATLPTQAVKLGRESSERGHTEGHRN